MKNKFIPIGKTLITASSLLLFSSCIKKVENTADTETGKAVVKGKVTADLIQTDTKPGPEDLLDYPVYVYVNTKDYAQNPGKSVYPKKRFVGKTDKTGKFEIPIEVSWSSAGSNIEIVVPSFAEDAPQNSGIPLRKTFRMPGDQPLVVGSVQDGAIVVRDIVLESL